MATLLQIRTQLVKDTGRYDLVDDAENADYSDNGADWYINAACKELDRRLDIKYGPLTFTDTVAAGTSLLQFRRARYIEQVWISTTTLGRKRLTRVTLDWLREHYADVPLSSVQQDEPMYWAPARPYLAPELSAATANTLTTDGITDIDFYVYGSTYLTDGIILMPPPDGTYTVQVIGQWLSKELSADADVNWWTVNEPALLVRATQREIEASKHRNTEGVRDYDNVILQTLNDISLDLTAEVVSGYSAEQMVMAG